MSHNSIDFEKGKMNMPIEPQVSFEDLSIRELWDLLEGYYFQHFPGSLRIHNGQGDTPIGALFGQLNDYSKPEDVIGEKEMLDGILTDCQEDPDDECTSNCHPVETKDVMWSPRWIPITSDGGGGNHCIDLDPSPEGTMGQVISHTEESSIDLLGKSFKEYFAKIVRDVLDGKLYDD
ncbi:unnamed protein product [Ambrosiozyma monospora]|uniref:Unnamed protein product n=1 Tax=Ambrosiozyma monospora TaxID=43982 RepID=A0ACB5SUN3_AMBMO|nr:unnamed protein product [Ambrosiozyma monospora]